ncbi:MAG: ABC transporter permease [Sulfurimonas sp. RIFOXYD12_FULL_33_39]|uniref:ABC transporter permease n=1 Tax=unclassified Sulfurimonas TaxID=2623549 RepID=UPI0008BF3B8B|nr:MULTISPECIES: ABC transporter permease [unclassified Sulfurimonas]OHE10573.1 MAG: ABC transporter permease [Sulfurimonas sp. RIFOXYD12_FULL_33_39]OHE15032.1 MAG: ABC transporter permease [Sulfurimonas sp. RIFOXYD2_FULL_34_21]DAB28537.1 MAG TPA: ABC transporter permease [Sulfurimonas sp. UBA10385]
MKHNILLAFSFAKRDFKERYFGTGLGQLWYILSPIITIFIYTVIFSDFMKMKLNIIDNSYAYSIYLIPGLLAWTSFSTIIMRLSTSIFEKANMIKKINVPMHTFQLSIVITELALFTLSISFGTIFLLLVNQPVTFSFLWMIPIMLLQTVFAFSLGVILSLFTPFFKDLKEAIPIVVQLWFWMTPIIYMREMVEKKYPSLLVYNPFYHFVHVYQDIFLFAKSPALSDLITIFLISFSTFILAAYLYKKMISTIKDII